MSAFIVSKAHIDALVQAAISDVRYPLRWQDMDPAELRGLTSDIPAGDWQEYQRVWDLHTKQADYTTAAEVGRMLWMENLKSVAYRYPDDQSGERPGAGDTDEEIAAYRYPLNARPHKPVEILKALACYEYQSCEHPGWMKSEAYQFCQALQNHMINRLPGYEEAPWEITEPKKIAV